MRARIEQNFATAGHRIWLYDRVMGKLHVLRLNDRGWIKEWETVDEGQADVAPTLEFPDGAFEALLDEARAHVSATDATVDALRDAREVRDRLLALVEDGWS